MKSKIRHTVPSPYGDTAVEIEASKADTFSSLSIIKEYENTKTEIENFKSFLKDLQSKIGKKIIIFVDELDRCRPDYAISTLEVIKHFFEIDSKEIKFVISIDKEQINNSIKTLYGQEAKTAGYLRKFIDIEFDLPEPELEDFIRFQFERFSSDKKIEIYKQNKHYFDFYSMVYTKLIQDICKVIEELELGLRDIEKIFLRVSIIIDGLDKESDVLFLDLLILLCCLRSKDVILLNEFIGGNIHKAPTLNKTGLYNNNINIFSFWFCLYRGIAQPNSNLDTIMKNITDYPPQGDRLRKINNFIEIISNYYKKIEFSENFSIPEDNR